MAVVALNIVILSQKDRKNDTSDDVNDDDDDDDGIAVDDEKGKPQLTKMSTTPVPQNDLDITEIDEK